MNKFIYIDLKTQSAHNEIKKKSRVEEKLSRLLDKIHYRENEFIINTLRNRVMSDKSHHVCVCVCEHRDCVCDHNLQIDARSFPQNVFSNLNHGANLAKLIVHIKRLVYKIFLKKFLDSESLQSRS